MKAILLSALLIMSIRSWSQKDSMDTTILNAIRREGFDHSQVMEIAFQLTDVAGPRVTNSPGYARAAQYAINTFESWGLKKIQRDSFYFGTSWSLEKSYLAMKTPYYRPIYGFPKVWTNGTNGLTTAPAFLINVDYRSDLEKYKGKLRGKMLLIDGDVTYRPTFKADAKRFSKSELEDLEGAVREQKHRIKNVLQIEKPKAGTAVDGGSVISALKRMAVREGAAGMLTFNPSSHDGTIVAGGFGFMRDPTSKAVPEFGIPLEDYYSTVRLLRSGIPVSFDLDLRVKIDTTNLYAFNVIAELEGEDPVLKQEVVMLGAHLDSWQAATGATDNASGVAVIMEAMRIIKTLNIHPKRTIRIALWSGEEQGMLGSEHYVRKTFFDAKTGRQLKAYNEFSAYYNHDLGSGKIRGIYLKGNDSARQVFTSWFKPFSDFGAATVSMEDIGSTDHSAFTKYGLPGFQFIQDPLDYWTRTHHTNVDSYDHLMPEDLKTNAVIMASFVYLTAMRDKKIPR